MTRILTTPKRFWSQLPEDPSRLRQDEVTLQVGRRVRAKDDVDVDVVMRLDGPWRWRWRSREDCASQRNRKRGGATGARRKKPFRSR